MMNGIDCKFTAFSANRLEEVRKLDEELENISCDYCGCKGHQKKDCPLILELDFVEVATGKKPDGKRSAAARRLWKLTEKE